MALNPKKLAQFVDKESKSPLSKKMRSGFKDKEHGGDDDEHEHDDGEDDEHDHGDDDEHDDIDVDAIAKQIEDGQGDKQLMKLARGVTADHNPPSWVTDEAKWEKAKEAVGVDEDGESDKYDQPYAVVAHVYKKMGGQVKGGGGKQQHHEHDDE